ncbi:MAG: nicotinate-nucleotide--dimethylbenzimidazole phosphoribosyltransferase [Candidatus Manganitrophaceae bacterium]|nr:MAG: nicotinate-nucleotide--dimethylbenzimidazole phosphoribosyltransferase [Candidatus Manganitrophaceae bacterium]
MKKIQSVIDRIQPPEESGRLLAKRRLDRLTKPPGSLGRLESLAVWYVGATGKVPVPPLQKAIVVFAGDHGVTEEKVSAYPKAVTAQMVYNFLNGGAAINVLARQAGADVRVIDMGVDHDFGKRPGLVDRKIARGTRNMKFGYALSRRKALSAIAVGCELAEEEARRGTNLLGTGEMGIGNTTASSAITALLTGAPVGTVTGRGTGIDLPALRAKRAVIQEAIRVNRPNRHDPIDVLSKVGGFEIAGIVGLLLGAAAHRIPVVVDGFISTAAALIAVSLAPEVKEYLLSAHRSAEPGHRIALAKLGLRPLFDLEMRLGEGTGAALAMGWVESAVRILTEMATFDEAGVSGPEREK